MTLENLQKEMILALKNKNKLRKDVLSSLVEAVKKAAIDNQCRDNIPENLVDTILLKEQKTVQEMIDTCPADRVENLAIYNEKIKIIKEFAPKLITDTDEIKTSIETILADSNIIPLIKNKGLIMRTIAPYFKGKADMKIVSQVIGEILK